MLSEKERKTLEDIEYHLYLDDPRLARSLTQGTTKKARPRRWPYTIALALLVALLIFGLVAALSVVAFAAAVLAGVVLGVQWLHREWRTRHDKTGKNITER